jgi:hypothetical protein
MWRVFPSSWKGKDLSHHASVCGQGNIISTPEARTTAAGPVTGHGIDNVELFWDGKSWWITSASIVLERAKELPPKGFLP